MSTRKPPETRHFHDLVASFRSMAGKTVMITGSSSGIGLILAETCARLGARIVMLNRASERADKALERVRDTGAYVQLVPCDLASFASVRAAGAELRARFEETGCDVLACNAGVMGMPDRATVDGFDIQMQANHLSHFLLTHEIWRLLEKAGELRGEARVVSHSSGARNRPKRRLQARYLRKEGGHLGGDGFPGMQKWVRYQQSKLANLMFTYALDERANARSDNRVKALCAHPGPTFTNLAANTANSGANGLLDRYIISSTLKIAHSAEDGTCGIARCCCQTNVESGSFFGPDAEERTGPALLLPPERDPDSEELLWTESLAAAGIADFFEPA